MSIPPPRTRAGVYKIQQEGFKTFVPKPLPPDPPLELDNELLNLLSKADQALGRLDGVTEVLPNPDLFVMMYVKKEAVLSSQIEGTQASLIDVLEFEAKALDPSKPVDVVEVVNFIKAINYGLEQIENGKEISISLLKEIHYHLLSGIRGSEIEPGKLRSVQNWIGPPGSNISEATFVPPNVEDMNKALNELKTFIKSEHEFPPLIKAGLVHSQFETIHPFIDDNGRIGRLLITLILIQNGHLTKPLLYLSYYFKKHQTEYYKRLQRVRDSGDWESWMKFFINGIYQVSSEAIRTSLKIIELRKEYQQMINKKFGNKSGSAMQLLDGLFSKPVIMINSIKEITSLSFPNANRLASEFEKIKILKEITGQKRNRIYEFVEYMDILNEGI
jgi:Fic family protein